MNMALNNQSGGNAGSRTAIDTLVWLIEDAFQEDSTHSLLANLHDMKDDEWTSLPVGAGRSIADILEHVGWCKWMYENYAFGSAAMRGDQPPLVPPGGARSRPYDELLRWLTEGHKHWLDSVRTLSNDAELEKERLTHWGKRLPTRTIIRIMIAHDLYHAGEINHLRALLNGTDRWEFE
ncbi:MAG: DinB family protein [Anaerolineaceae bacterium]|nr:DinB family protein [Anaerolineaceae bacterium]